MPLLPIVLLPFVTLFAAGSVRANAATPSGPARVYREEIAPLELRKDYVEGLRALIERTIAQAHLPRGAGVIERFATEDGSVLVRLPATSQAARTTLPTALVARMGSSPALGVATALSFVNDITLPRGPLELIFTARPDLTLERWRAAGLPVRAERVYDLDRVIAAGRPDGFVARQVRIEGKLPTAIIPRGYSPLTFRLEKTPNAVRVAGALLTRLFEEDSSARLMSAEAGEVTTANAAPDAIKIVVVANDVDSTVVRLGYIFDDLRPGAPGAELKWMARVLRRGVFTRPAGLAFARALTQAPESPSTVIGFVKASSTGVVGITFAAGAATSVELDGTQQDLANFFATVEPVKHAFVVEATEAGALDTDAAMMMAAEQSFAIVRQWLDETNPCEGPLSN